MLHEIASQNAPAAVVRQRVLHVGKFYTPYRGGMESHLQLLCERIQKDVDVRVVVSATTEETVHESINGIPVTRLGTRLRIAGASFSPGMRAEIAATRGLVHVHLPNPTATLAYLASGHRGPLVATYHSDIVRQRIIGAAYLPVLRRFLRRCDAIIVASPDYVESSSVLRCVRDRCVVIPFGIDIAAFQAPSSHTRAIREEFGSRIVLAVGRLVTYKGFEYLVEAMAQVDARLLLIGDGPLRGSLERQVQRLGISHRVSLLGEVPDVAPYMHASDVFVLPSVTRAEAFGIVQLEAMAARVPVVNTALATGVPFVSRHEESGLTVPPRNAGAIASAVNRLLDDPDGRSELGRGGRARLETLFSLDAMSARTLEVYARAGAWAPST